MLILLQDSPHSAVLSRSGPPSWPLAAPSHPLFFSTAAVLPRPTLCTPTFSSVGNSLAPFLSAMPFHVMRTSLKAANTSKIASTTTVPMSSNNLMRVPSCSYVVVERSVTVCKSVLSRLQRSDSWISRE